jgi:hypothetical protein
MKLRERSIGPQWVQPRKYRRLRVKSALPPMNGHRQFEGVASRNMAGSARSSRGYTGRASERTGRQPVAPMAPTLILDPCCDPDGFLLHRSGASLRWRQCFSFRDGSNTRSTCRFRALITPTRANMVGPPRSATSMSAPIAACHSGRSDLGTGWTCPWSFGPRRWFRTFGSLWRLGPGWGYGWGPGWGGDACVRWRQVWAGWGWRVVPVNVCW